jgi:hypothetical protein
MDQRRTLLVLRHAETEDTRPGSRDSERRLTPDGERNAQQVSDYLRKQGVIINTVLCSSAVRARQTFELLKLDVDPDCGKIADLFLQRRWRHLDQRCPRASRRLPRRLARRTCAGAHRDSSTSWPIRQGPIRKRLPRWRVGFRLLPSPGWSSRVTGRRRTQPPWCFLRCPVLPAADSRSSLIRSRQAESSWRELRHAELTNW